jgi:hypothetical protein
MSVGVTTDQKQNKQKSLTTEFKWTFLDFENETKLVQLSSK